MVVLCITVVITLLAGGAGVYALVKKFCWREINEYIPYAAGAAFVILFSILITAGIGMVKNNEYDSAYEYGYTEARIDMYAEIADKAAENAETREHEYADIYSEAYNKAFTDFTAIIGSMQTEPSRTIPNTEDEPEPDSDVLELLPDDETEETDETDIRTMPDGSDEKEETPATGVTVYYTPSGSVLHKDRNCHYLKNASKILSSDISKAPNRKMCSSCG